MSTSFSHIGRPAIADVHRTSRLSLTGIGSIARHIVRQDRVRMLIWTLSIAAFTLYFIFALSNVFDPRALAARATVMRTPAGIIMGGPGYGLENYTPSVALANEGTLWFISALSIMSILHVIRHTRAEEENGRAELVRASAVGRHAAPMAAMITLVAHLAITVVAASIALILGGSNISVPDAFAMMTGVALIALVFGAAALVAAQITPYSRTATGIAITVFGVAFAIRAIGDLQQQGGSLLSWFSPIGWAQQTRPFVDLRLWPWLLALGMILILGMLALYLSSRRDFDAGLIATQPGPSIAATWLREPFGMAWIQQRGVLLWTTLGLGITWFGTGTLLSTLDDMIADIVETNPMFARVLGDDSTIFVQAFLDMIMLFVALSCTAYVVAMGQRPRAEEESGRLELVLAGPVSRIRWLAAHFTIAALGAVFLLIVSTFALWAGATVVDVTEPGLSQYVVAILAYIPAILSFLTFTLALFGWLPHLISTSWVLVAYAFVVGMFGPIFNLPAWMLYISPFKSAGSAFTEGVNVLVAVMFGVVALVLGVLAVAGFRRRDLSTA